MYLTKFLDTSIKSFFFCNQMIIIRFRGKMILNNIYVIARDSRCTRDIIHAGDKSYGDRASTNNTICDVSIYRNL